VIVIEENATGEEAGKEKLHKPRMYKSMPTQPAK